MGRSAKISAGEGGHRSGYGAVGRASAISAPICSRLSPQTPPSLPRGGGRGRDGSRKSRGLQQSLCARRTRLRCARRAGCCEEDGPGRWGPPNSRRERCSAALSADMETHTVSGVRCGCAMRSPYTSGPTHQRANQRACTVHWMTAWAPFGSEHGHSHSWLGCPVFRPTGPSKIKEGVGRACAEERSGPR